MNRRLRMSRRHFVAGASAAVAATGAGSMLLPRGARAQSIARGGTITLSVPEPVANEDPVFVQDPRREGTECYMFIAEHAESGETWAVCAADREPSTRVGSLPRARMRR